jgi:hypothetical protein
VLFGGNCNNSNILTAILVFELSKYLAFLRFSPMAVAQLYSKKDPRIKVDRNFCADIV